MKNYSRHNDLIDNFFYLIKRMYSFNEESSIQNLEPYSYLDYMNETELKGELSVKEFEQENLPKELIELNKIISILKLRIDFSDLFENNDILLISRYLIFNWKQIIKEQIAIGFEKGKKLDYFKNLIISVFKEIEYRTDLSYTLYLKDIILYHYSYSTNDLINLCSNSIKEDIEWIKNIAAEDIKNRKLILHKKASKKDIVKVLSLFLKTNRTLSEEKDYLYENRFKGEIVKFVDAICFSSNSENLDKMFDLRFIPKGKNNINIINFSKIFYYAKSKGIIKSNQGEINKILSDSFNIAERYFENITKSTIEKENTNQDFIDFVLNPFKKRIN